MGNATVGEGLHPSVWRWLREEGWAARPEVVANRFDSYTHAVITELRIGNARLFEGEDWRFPFGSLTILCGTNSAGKSTVLKCLLLLRQALISREASLTQENRSKLRLSGGPIELGNFRSFISHNEVDRELKLGITIFDAMDAAGLMRSPDQLSLPNLEHSLPDSQFIPYSLSADFYFGKQPLLVQLDGSEAARTGTNDSDPFLKETSGDGHAILKKGVFKIRHDDKTILTFEVLSETNASGAHIGYLLRLPRPYVETLPELESVDLGESDGDYVNLRTTLRGVLPERLFARSRADEASAPRYWPLPSHIEEVLQDLRLKLYRVSYLGPLRAPAQRYYTGQGDSNPDFDVTGESLPYILTDKLNELVFSATPVAHKKERVPLAAALNSWLYYLRTGKVSETEDLCRNELMVSSVHDVLVSLGIKSQNGRESHALADSGFGYSQVLPILVKGLMMPRGSLLLVEQPEVHLNPALQVRIADFLAAMASRQKQIVIESHSEHLVNAIRAESAEAFLREAYEKDLSQIEISGRYAILYLDNLNGEARIHKLSILQDGTVPDWPSSFFAESSQLLGRIFRAQKGAKGQK
jgi:predicted ATPase